MRRFADQLSAAVECVPVHLRIGLALGATSFLIGLMPMVFQAWLPESLVEGSAARALWLTAKWITLGAGLQGLRRWTLRQAGHGGGQPG